MATVTTQTVFDGPKKTVMIFTGSFAGAGGDESAVVKVQGLKLSGALAVDTNNNVLVSAGGNYRTNYNYAITRIVSDIYNCTVQISWTGGSPATAWIAGPGKGDNNVEEQLGSIWNNATNPTGNIAFTTANTNAGSSYTIMLELKKGGNSGNSAVDYSVGQTVRPVDFNFKPYSVTP